MYDVITIGGATRDFFFVIDKKQLKIVKTPKDLTAPVKIMFEFGAKIIPQQVHFSLGGGATNTAVAMSRLELKVASYISTGRGEDCNLIISNLQAEKVDTKYVVCDRELQAGISFILLVADKSVEHTVFTYRGANDHLFLSTTRKYPTRWFYLTSLSGQWQENLARVHQVVNRQGMKLAWNPGGAQIAAGYPKLKNLLELTEVFNVNHDEAIELALSAGGQKNKVNNIDYLLKTIAAWGPRTVVITNGTKGADCYCRGKKHHVARYPLKRIDTAGAGDAFGGSFVAGLVKYRYNIDRALKLAAINASYVVAQIGTQAGLLYKKDLKKMNTPRSKLRGI